MTRTEMITAYTKAYQNQLSSSAERRMRELEEEADRQGLRFEMTNRTQYMMPHYLGAPRFDLVSK
jgi:hypothetical protein